MRRRKSQDCCRKELNKKKKKALCAHKRVDRTASSSVTLVSAQGRLAKTNDKSSDDAASAVDCATLACQTFTLGRDFFRNHLFTCTFSASTFQVTRELTFSLRALSRVIFPSAQNGTRLKPYTSPAIRSFFFYGTTAT